MGSIPTLQSYLVSLAHAHREISARSTVLGVCIFHDIEAHRLLSFANILGK